MEIRYLTLRPVTEHGTHCSLNIILDVVRQRLFVYRDKLLTSLAKTLDDFREHSSVQLLHISKTVLRVSGIVRVFPDGFDLGLAQHITFSVRIVVISCHQREDLERHHFIALMSQHNLNASASSTPNSRRAKRELKVLDRLSKQICGTVAEEASFDDGVLVIGISKRTVDAQELLFRSSRARRLVRRAELVRRISRRERSHSQTFVANRVHMYCLSRVACGDSAIHIEPMLVRPPSVYARLDHRTFSVNDLTFKTTSALRKHTSRIQSAAEFGVKSIADVLEVCDDVFDLLGVQIGIEPRLEDIEKVGVSHLEDEFTYSGTDIICLDSFIKRCPTHRDVLPEVDENILKQVLHIVRSLRLLSVFDSDLKFLSDVSPSTALFKSLKCVVPRGHSTIENISLSDASLISISVSRLTAHRVLAHKCGVRIQNHLRKAPSLLTDSDRQLTALNSND